jgi:hypothetical protein
MTTIPLVSRTEFGIHTRRTPEGVLVASAFCGRQGWHVTRQAPAGSWHQYFVASEEDAFVVLDAIGGAS